MSVVPWDELRLDQTEQQALACTSGDACSLDVVLLIGEVRRLHAERDAARREVAAIREMVGGLDGESTVDAVRDMATEHEHYSKEMNKAGYYTIPALEAERDATRRALMLAQDALFEISIRPLSTDNAETAKRALGHLARLEEARK